MKMFSFVSWLLGGPKPPPEEEHGVKSAPAQLDERVKPAEPLLAQEPLTQEEDPRIQELRILILQREASFCEPVPYCFGYRPQIDSYEQVEPGEPSLQELCIQEMKIRLLQRKASFCEPVPCCFGYRHQIWY